MTSTRQFGTETYLAIKAAFRDLVKASGGQVRAVHVTRGCQSKLSEAMSPEHLERFPALDQVADLEAEAGAPVVTKLLAGMAGFDLVPRIASGTDASLYQHLAAIVKEAGEVESIMASALADGTVDAAERKRLKSEAHEAITALHNLIASVDASMRVKVVK